jgi:hypothetical protein
MSDVKKFMFVNRKAPHGTIYALESLEVVLITAGRFTCFPGRRCLSAKKGTANQRDRG